MLFSLADTRRYVVLAALVFFAVFLSAPTTASAAAVLGGGYTSSALSDANGVNYSCAVWSAGTDGNGNAYLPCYDNIIVVDKTGRRVNTIALPTNLRARRDVAVSNDGATVYYVSGWCISDIPYLSDPAQCPDYWEVGKVIKLVRGSDNIYRQDTSFNVGQIMLAGNLHSFRNLDVDKAGRIYITINAFVYIYDSAGHLLDLFGGDDMYDVAGNYLGGIEVAQGIAVSEDGNHIYVVEQKWNHIQRWDRGVSGHYSRSSWRIGGLTRTESDCIDDTTFSSPYDVALDGAGHLFVLDVTCRRIQEYVAATGAHTNTVWQFYNPVFGQDLYHGISVDYLGSVVVPEQGRRYQKAVVSGSCLPDYDAPTIPTVITHSTVYTKTVTVGIKPHDYCSAVVAMSADGDLTAPIRWRTVGKQITFTLTSGDGIKYINLNVRDAYGRVGTRRISLRLDTTQPPLIARHNVSLWGRTKYCASNPMSHLTTPSRYRLLDRCATITGTLEAVQRFRGGKVLTIRLSLKTSQKLYINARIPAALTAVGVVRAPHKKPFVLGRTVAVTGAIITNRAGTVVSMAPVGQWYGG